MQGNVIDVGYKPMFFLEMVSKIMEMMIGKRNHMLAISADKVVVGVDIGDFIDSLTINHSRKDKLMFIKEVDGPINGGAVNRRRSLMHVLINLIDRCMSPHVAERIHDQLALRGHSIPQISEPLNKILLIMRHRQLPLSFKKVSF